MEKYLDTTLSAQERAEALTDAMTTEEQASQLRYDSPAVKRLGIPAYNWWNEALHGLARSGVATMFPLDPISTSKIEELAMELRKKYTIIIVTHNMQQAARIADKTAFFLLGELVEFDSTEKIFNTPSDKRTEDYITGRFG